jgi:uncharacterized coiled-coil DUF342 family protein
MKELIEIINTIIHDWWLLGFFFTLGGLWWQGKTWFEGVNKKLGETSAVHDEQNKMLTELHNKVSNIEEKVERMDQLLTKVHEEVHTQEVKLAVLESKPTRQKSRSGKISQ